MKILHDVSPQKVSWVKSNKDAFEKTGNLIRNLYYPETQTELISLIAELQEQNKEYMIIGYSSNTLFLPTFSVENMICTKELKSWHETDDSIVCDCGVNVSSLSKNMVDKGICGFDGLTDLPGTIASGVYGNCGCRGCTVIGVVKELKLLTKEGGVKTIYPDALKPTYRSTSLKRGELKGIIVEVTLMKQQGNVEEIKAKALYNHNYRKKTQPSAANNLGTTFNGGNVRTLRGFLYKLLGYLISLIKRTKDQRVVFPTLLRIIGKGKFSPYVYYWNRYMFIDSNAHILFPEYFAFLKSMYKDVRLEIEIKGLIK